MENRFEPILEVLRPVARALDPPNIHWVSNGDAGPDWCAECIDKHIAELKAENPDSQAEADGGYDPGHETEGSACCEGCGCLLSYSLIDYGAREELRHFADRADEGVIGRPVSSEEIYEVYEMLSAISYFDNKPDHQQDVDLALKVGWAYVAAIVHHC